MWAIINGESGVCNLLVILGCCLFTDQSGLRMRLYDFFQAQQPDTLSTYSRGSTTLAYLYRQLGDASRAGTVGIGGCLTLLQAWIYEYFPCFRPHKTRNYLDHHSPRAWGWNVHAEEMLVVRLRGIRMQIDRLSASQVMWFAFTI